MYVHLGDKSPVTDESLVNFAVMSVHATSRPISWGPVDRPSPRRPVSLAQRGSPDYMNGLARSIANEAARPLGIIRVIFNKYGLGQPGNHVPDILSAARSSYP